MRADTGKELEVRSLEFRNLIYKSGICECKYICQGENVNEEETGSQP